MSNYKEKESERFEIDTNTDIMPSHINNLDELEKEYEKYSSMHKDLRRRSDWKSQELYGKTNPERYNELKAKLLANDNFDIQDIPLEENGYYLKEEVEDDKVDFEDISYPPEATEQAETWSIDSMRAIVRPVSDIDKLDDLWHNFNSMIRKHQRESDWKSIELFGIDNKTHYEYLRSKFLKEDIKDDPTDNPEETIDTDHTTTIGASIEESYIEKMCRYIKSSNLNKYDQLSECLKLANTAINTTFCENILIQNTIDDTIELFKDHIADITAFNIDDLPFFDPDEMIDLGIFNKDTNLYSVADNDMLDNDITTKNWFENYNLLFNGIKTENTAKYTKSWIHKLQELYLDYNDIKESGDTNKIKARKQSILELGWNPELDFNIENRLKAKNRILSILNDKYGSTELIDLSTINIDESYNDNTVVNEISTNNPLYPIFIVLVEGKSHFSTAIKAFTKNIFTHAAISFDSKLDKLYSYNMNPTIGNGLTYESIKQYPQNSKLGVYSIFVTEKDLRTIRKNLDYFIDHKDETKYSFLNVFTLPLNIPIELDFKMICSQFVDRLLKLANIDITNKSSSLVTPADFVYASKDNKKIYQLYDGVNSDYNPKKSNRILHSLVGNAKYIKENALVSINEILSKYLPANALLEAKEFPVQFDDDGNLLIKSINKLDFEAEYAKIHKLLLVYDRNKNIEGLKYELSKLWLLNTIIEPRLYNLKYEKDKPNLTKARARILNDFYKYLDIVIKHEKDFNFTEYYNNSPFSDIIKIRSSTLKYTGKLIKDIISPITKG